MINKEILLNADGTIKKDFQDRNIPQYSNNQVSVNVLIPSACFNGLQNYAVILGVSRVIGNSETTLNSLIMTASKTITLEGVLYVKYSAILSYSYTDKIATLKVSPYIQTTSTTTINDVVSEVITIQQAFTNSNLNVIKSVLPQYDASLEEGTIATTLAEQIADKKIYTFIDLDSASLGQHYYELVNGYDPNASQFAGCLVISTYDNEMAYYMPYLNDGDNELLEITSGGVFYKISNVSYDSGTSTYTYTREKISYTKSELDSALNLKADKSITINGYDLSQDRTLTKGDVGLGNVANYGVENTPTAVGENLYITSKGVYDALQSIYSLLSSDYATKTTTDGLDARLDSVETIIGSDDGDADSVINTLKEVIVVLNGLGEGASLLDLINAKANQSDLTALSGTVSAMGLKVDLLYDSNANAYAEIKAQSGTIDILTSDWVANTDTYASDFPYKYELSNGYLIGASNVIVVFSVDSDTSLLSTSVGIDDTNGKVIIYASDTPQDTIKIEKIAVFNSVNAYELYNQTLVSQVASNTSAISDINNTKLPQYLKKTGSNAGITSEITNNGSKIQLDVSKTSGQKTTIYNSETEYYVKHYKDNDSTGLKAIQVYEQNVGGVKQTNLFLKADGTFKITVGSGTTHDLTFDANGDLKIDGNAVGGGKQLYQHNILITGTISSNPVELVLTIPNNDATPFTKATLLSWLNSNGFDGGGTNYAYPYYMVNGYKGANAFVIGVQVTLDDLSNGRFRIKTANNSGNGAFTDGAVQDVVVAL